MGDEHLFRFGLRSGVEVCFVGTILISGINTDGNFVRRAIKRHGQSWAGTRALPPDNPPPLPEETDDFVADILDQAIHLDIIPIQAERVFELAGDAIDTVEGEADQTHDWDGPPAYFPDEGERKDAAEKREDLFLMDEDSDGDGGEADRLHVAVGIHQSIELALELRGLRGLEGADVGVFLDVGFDEECQLEGQTDAGVVLQTFEVRGEEVRVFWVRDLVSRDQGPIKGVASAEGRGGVMGDDRVGAPDSSLDHLDY